MRLSTRLHGFLDYAMAMVLVALPWVAGFDSRGPETWVPVALGGILLSYSLITDYELGLLRRLGMPVHLWLDGAGGFLLAASPWILAFEQRVWIPFVALGLAEILVAAVTDTVPAYDRRRSH